MANVTQNIFEGVGSGTHSYGDVTNTAQDPISVHQISTVSMYYEPDFGGNDNADVANRADWKYGIPTVGQIWPRGKYTQ